MEDKKNQKPSEERSGKKRPPRRHGYFMEPPTEKQSAEIKEATENQHKNKHHQQRVPTEKAEKLERVEKTAPEQKKNNKNNRKNKNKHKNVSKPQAELKEQAVKAANQNQAQKKKTPPLEKAEKSSKPERPANTHNPSDYEAYDFVVKDEDITPSAEVTEAPKPKPAEKPSENDSQTEVIGVRFKSTGKTYYFDPCGKAFKRGSGAIVDTARGLEYGEVAISNTRVSSSDIVPPLRAALRTATPEDIRHHKENKLREDEAFRICNEKIAAHKLDMKLIEAQYTFDNSKLLFYFTSSERVDFRELVKDLAAEFRTRIELRQIGIRDEAKLMGGLGMCGRPLCCSLFLTDFNQVSIKMAKEQNLSLNSAKISGICGRLMCCLKYEHEAYEYEIKHTPPVDSIVRTESGDGIITDISPIAGTVKVKLFSAPDAPPKTFKRSEIKMLRKKEK